MNLIFRNDRIGQLYRYLGGQLETEVLAFGTDMEKYIAGRGQGHRMTRLSDNLTKRMKFGRPRLSKERIPYVGSESNHAGKVSGRFAKADRSQQLRQITA
jgi:hypothetical protein